MKLLFICGIIPFVLSFFPPIMLFRKGAALFKTILLVMFVYGGWDVFATLRGHWSFNPAAVGSIRIANLPLEEALFFIVIPFCCIFTWEAIKFLTERSK